MAMPTYVGAFEYKNNDGSPVNLSSVDIIINIPYTNFSEATVVGLSVLLEDGSANTYETDQTWASGSVPSHATFAMSSYSPHVDLSDIVFMRVGVGVDGGSYENMNITIDTFIREVGGE